MSIHSELVTQRAASRSLPTSALMLSDVCKLHVVTAADGNLVDGTLVRASFMHCVPHGGCKYTSATPLSAAAAAAARASKRNYQAKCLTISGPNVYSTKPGTLGCKPRSQSRLSISRNSVAVLIAARGIRRARAPGCATIQILPA